MHITNIQEQTQEYLKNIIRKEYKMEKSVVISSVVAILVLLSVAFAIPVLAHEPVEEGETLANQAAWKAMHEACVTGDWNTMIKAAKEVNNGYLTYRYCH